MDRQWIFYRLNHIYHLNYKDNTKEIYVGTMSIKGSFLLIEERRLYLPIEKDTKSMYLSKKIGVVIRLYVLYNGNNSVTYLQTY